MAKKDVGDYLNQFYVSSFQKVGTFRINQNGNKQGGNVASYFCTMDGEVLHVVAGPVDDATLLREARWVVETCKLAQLEGRETRYKLQKHFREEHVNRLKMEHGLAIDARYLPTLVAKRTAPRLGEYALRDRRFRSRRMTNQGKVHKILAYYPLPKVSQIYHSVFEDILRERISMRPVNKNN